MLRRLSATPALFINEPGDATHYEFTLIRIDGDYYIINHRKCMNLPGMIESFEVLPSVDDRNFSEELILMANSVEVNPNTMNQVMLAIEKYKEMED